MMKTTQIFMRKWWVEIVLGSVTIGELCFRIKRSVIISDDATYAFRSIRLVDFMASGSQTTPWQWFNPLPWWVSLSFHDAPGLFFWLEHLAFKYLGVSTLVALIVPIVSGCLAAAMVYAIVQKLHGRQRARFALVILLCLNPFIWIQRLPLLESLMIPWLLVAWYAYLRARRDRRWYWLVGLAGGLALITKYTAIFFFLAVLVHFTWHRNKDWRDSRWWGGLVVAFFVVSPVIVYNILLLLTRGHFDVQLAALFGQSNADWPILSTHINTNIASSLGQLAFTLGGLYSWAVVIMCGWAVFRLVHYHPRDKKISSNNWFTVILFLSWLLVIVLTRSDDRFIATGYFFPVVCLVASIPRLPVRVWNVSQRMYGITMFLVMLFSWSYLVNTNYISRPWGSVNIHYSDSRRETYGLLQVDSIMKSALTGKKPTVILSDSLTDSFDPQQRNKILYDPDSLPLAQNPSEIAPVIIYDRNMNWFGSLWYFYRWSFYQGYTVLNTYQVNNLLVDPSQQFLTAVHGQPYILFMTTDFSLRDSPKYFSAPYQTIIDLEERSEKAYIFDDYGRPVWEVYTGTF
jgi:hypothetical protein